ncbi:MAG: exodeoxyribonuclease V subunit gamma [Gemmataceae bacterium]|nr:exodeoxyribonuclease V subunit gamma [Gemmataceae bacterium]
MSVLYLAADAEVLAGKLADLIDAQIREGDFFRPIDIVVPNRFLGRWLKLWLARKMGVAVNLRFRFLESALWDWYRAIDPRPIEPLDPDHPFDLSKHPSSPEFLEPETYRLLVLSVLLHEDSDALALFRHYLQRADGQLRRRSCRRAWQLAGLLSDFIRDYEYHRQQELIQPWLRGQLGLPPGHGAESLERGQRDVFQHIIGLPDGKRQLLINATGRNFKTLPQYVMEVREVFETLHPPLRDGKPATVHLFGLTQISRLHVEALRFLGPFFDLRVYHLNALAGRLPRRLDREQLQGVAESFIVDRRSDKVQAGDSLLHLWGRAGAESFWLMAEFLSLPSFSAEGLVASPTRGRRAKPTVLSRLREYLFTPDKFGDDDRLPQDTSLQVVGCPGILREVETVHNSILHNLQENPDLRQTDIAVLAVDMGRYRPVLQAVFERPPHPVAYNLIDYSAAGLSTFGHALMGMLDLALESFTRSKVFEVLLSPCILARLGVDRHEAMTWVDWAEKLGIHQGWDASEKHEQGLPATPQFGWKLGLQRLRLGRFMVTVPDDHDGDTPRFGDIVPFADLESSDRSKLDRFCLAIEGLLPRLRAMRHFQGTGPEWAERIRELVVDFFDVPEDRPEEGEVRDRLLASLDRLSLWDQLAGPGKEPHPLPLALIREYLLTQLETIPGSQGQALVGGVTLTGLQPMRPVPFKIVYVLGMGEKNFPGSNFLTALDLRNLGDRPRGDIRPAEHQRFIFLETILSAAKNLYLFYDNRDLQKDEPLFPAVPVQQLRQFLDRCILREPFQEAAMPLHGHDEAFLDPLKKPAWHDVLVQYRETDRLLAVMDADKKGRFGPSLFPRAELHDRIAELTPDFSLTPSSSVTQSSPPTIALRELRSYLKCPAEAMLKRHLRIDDEPESQDEEDYEPLTTSRLQGMRLVQQVLTQIVTKSAAGQLDQVLEEWVDRFEATYDGWRMRCKAPEEAFGEIDRAALRQELHERIFGKGRLASFLRERVAKPYVDLLALGASLRPVEAKIRFPALSIPLARTLPHSNATHANLVGDLKMTWVDAHSLDVLVLTSARKWSPTDLSMYLLEPVLMYLSLLAHDDPSTKGLVSEWMAARDLCVHVAFAEGLGTVRYPAGMISPEEARAYLSELAADFLDPNRCELLPFRCLEKKPMEALFLQEYDPIAADEFREKIEEALENDGVFGRPLVWDLVHRINVTVPEDALEIMQRRFRLINMGPALNREPNDSASREEEDWG